MEKEQRKKKKLPQNTEALLDELDSDSRSGDDAEFDAEKLLAEIDPNLAASLKDLTNDFANISDEIASLDLDGQSPEDDTVPLKERIKHRIERIRKFFKNKAVSWAYSLKYFFIWLFTDGFKKAIYFLGYFFRYLQKFFTRFSKWSFKKKVGFIFTFSILITITFGFFYVVKSKLLYQETFKFIGSVAEVASYSFNYDSEAESESFYSSPRVRTYSFQLRPIVVNLKRREGSARNPMGFFEFVLDGSSGDVLVEVKTRETEIADMVQRIVESIYYEDIDSQDGKLVLKETLRKELNKILVEGSLRKVQIQSIIIKP